MPQTKKSDEPSIVADAFRGKDKKLPERARDNEKSPRGRREQPVLHGVRSLSTPPGEPYNDVLLRRPLPR